MCGRYYIEVDNRTLEEIKNICSEIEREYPNAKIQTGEIFPSSQVPILAVESKVIKAMPAVWGFSFAAKGQRIINARSETIEEKALFRDSFLDRRCVFPATSFFEWSSDKKKHEFFPLDEEIMYIGGVCRFERRTNTNTAVIMTMAAGAVVAPIHDRMPVLISKSRLESWFSDVGYARRLIAAGDSYKLGRR
jgi:putative SOS response-associated peptidase YedK